MREPFVNRRARDWTSGAPKAAVRDFHRTLPGYAPTPLREVPVLAHDLGVGRLLVKDESACTGSGHGVAGLRGGAAMGRRRLRDVARRSGRVPWRGPRPRCRPRRCGLPRPSGGDAYRRLGTGGCRILSVEPDTAAGILASLQSGEPTSVPTADPIMAGLNCGTVSAAAWPVLRRGLDAAISVHDDEARTAVTDLATEGVSAGPCGAATLAGLTAYLGRSGARDAIDLPDDAIVVLLSTEGVLR